MAALLEEWDETWVNWPDTFDYSQVVLKKNGMYVKMPNWLKNYRHPDHAVIDSIKVVGQ